jgi:hypothetical protein
VSKCSRRTRRRFAQVGSGTSLCLRYRMPDVATRLPAAPVLSRAAKQRLKILDYARTHSVAATCATSASPAPRTTGGPRDTIPSTSPL